MNKNQRENPDALTLRRIRNRIIEELELASSFDLQIEYERRVPIANVPVEVINQWEDWISSYEEIDLRCPLGIYSDEEINEIKKFHLIWVSVTERLPNPLLPLPILFQNQEWVRLRDAAQTALNIFLKNGKSPE